MEYTEERQRLAQQAIEKYGLPRLLVAASIIMAQQSGKKGASYTQDEIIPFLEGLDEEGVRHLVQIAETIEEGNLH
jgi:hypothetical protein